MRIVNKEGQIAVAVGNQMLTPWISEHRRQEVEDLVTKNELMWTIIGNLTMLIVKNETERKKDNKRPKKSK